MNLRELSDKKDLTIHELTIDLYNIYYFVASLIITLAFYLHCI